MIASDTIAASVHFNPRNPTFISNSITPTLLWITVLPVAFIASLAVTLSLPYLKGLVHHAAGESAGRLVEWLVFAVRSILFVALGALVAPSARVTVAIVLAVIQTVASVTPVGNPTCRFATFLGVAGPVIYFIAT